MVKTTQTVIDMAIEILTAASRHISVTMFPGVRVVVRTIENASREIDAASERGIEDLHQEITKQELRLGFEMQQARIAQELAIAQRITSANTVEIEEFYDKSGSGQAGIGVDGEGLKLGLGGDGKSVVKRIYKFSGHAISPVDTLLPSREETNKLDAEDAM